VELGPGRGTETKRKRKKERKSKGRQDISFSYSGTRNVCNQMFYDGVWYFLEDTLEAATNLPLFHRFENSWNRYIADSQLIKAL
jgi:hypothetical protein